VLFNIDVCCIIQTVDRISCLPTKEKSVSVENGENGIAVATVVEKCQCVSECYRKSYYEKYREIASRKEVVRIVHTNVHTTSWLLCHIIIIHVYL